MDKRVFLASGLLGRAACTFATDYFTHDRGHPNVLAHMPANFAPICQEFVRRN